MIRGFDPPPSDAAGDTVAVFIPLHGDCIDVGGVLLANDTVGEVRGLTEIREKIEVMSLRDLNQEAH